MVGVRQVAGERTARPGPMRAEHAQPVADGATATAHEAPVEVAVLGTAAFLAAAHDVVPVGRAAAAVPDDRPSRRAPRRAASRRRASISASPSRHDLERRVDRDRRAQGDLDGAVAAEGPREAAGQHAADIAAVARQARAVEAAASMMSVSSTCFLRGAERGAHMRRMQACRPVRRLAPGRALVEVGSMGSIMPWALVALCFALGVASRSISDTFVVFVPALQQAFDAHRGSVTLIYSFALLVGGIARADRRLDRRSLRPAHAHGRRRDGRDAGDGQRLAGDRALASLSRPRRRDGLRRRLALRRAERLAARPLVSGAAAGRGAGRRLVGVGRGRHGHVPAGAASDHDGRLAPRLHRLRHHERRCSSRCCCSCRGRASNAARRAWRRSARRPTAARPSAKRCATGRSGRSPRRSR